MTTNDGLRILEMLLNGGVVNVLMALIGLVVLAFIGFVGVIAWLAITQVPIFNQHLGEISQCLNQSKNIFSNKFESIENKVNTIHTLIARN